MAENGTPHGSAHHRVLSVDEALQYSPFSSTTTYGLDCINVPALGYSGPSSIFTTPDERNAARQVVADLDQELQTNNGGSAYLNSTLQDIQGFLDGDELTEFQFRLPRGVEDNAKQSSLGKSSSASPFTSHLSPFAKMVLESTNVAYRYPSPRTPTPKAPRHQKTSKTVKAPQPIITPNSNSSIPPESLNQQAFQHNAVLDKVLITPTSSSSAVKSAPAFQVLVPSLPSSAPKSEYVDIPSRVRDRQEEAETALLQFHDYLQTVFEAEDELPSEPTLNFGTDTNSFFVPITACEDIPFVLSHTVHSKLQSSIQKLSGYAHADAVSVDYLVRLKKLCENTLLSAQNLNLSLEPGYGEEDAQDWISKLEAADYGLVSSGTLIRFMMAIPGERKIRSEDMIEAIPALLKNVFENCIIPVVEARSQGKNAEVYSAFSTNKKLLGNLMQHARKVLNLFSDLLSRIEIPEMALNSMEYLLTKILFVENATSEKESIFGIQKYETVRRSAMESLAKIFSKYPDQRDFILNDILESLDKLPVTQKSARQFKVEDGQSIQLLTALVLQLVQTTTFQTESFSAKKRRRLPDVNGDASAVDMSADEDAEYEDDNEVLDANVSIGFANSPNTKELLNVKMEILHDNMLRSADHIIKIFVSRAMTSTKSGDEPYRNLLDLFTQDLIVVLESADWPAAEILLGLLASRMIGITGNDKHTSNAKNMALELLGWMGSAISDSIASLKSLGSTIDRNESDLSGKLGLIIDDQLQGGVRIEDLLSRSGPFRIALEYLWGKDGDSLQLSSGRSFLLVQWARQIIISLQSSQEDDRVIEDPVVLEKAAKMLISMLSNPKWFENESEFASPTTSCGRAAYIIAILNLRFCRSYNGIVKILLGSLTSDQAKVRSRSLKSVISMLEKDPNLLDREPTVIRVIFRSAMDQSPMVRDSALTLIGKCVLLKPVLEDEARRVIMTCMDDQNSGVRKRCIGLLREIYSRSSQQEAKAEIAESLLQRMQDQEDNIRELATQMVEEAWFTAYSGTVDTMDESAKNKVAFREHVALIVKCVQLGESVVNPFEVFLKKILIESSKNASSNTKVCRALVATMFDAIIEGSEFPGNLEKRALLKTITIFAKAAPTLVTPEQLKILQPDIATLSTNDDLYRFRSIVIIYRRVLPYLSAAQETLLREVQGALMNNIQRLPRTELNEVMACLWSIDGVLKNTERLARLALSVLTNMHKFKGQDLSVGSRQNESNRLTRYLTIAGCVGKYCDLDEFAELFKKAFTWWKGGSVSGLMIDIISPFTAARQPSPVRKAALESLVAICQSWPGQFTREFVRRQLDSIFEEQEPDLQDVILRTFAEFFTINEGKKENLANFDGTSGTMTTSRFVGSLNASDTDGAVAMIARHFLTTVLQVCSSRQDSYGLTAIEVVASINRQGLVLPKECAGVLVAAETSTNDKIAKIAFETHKIMHLQYESMLEREYMKAAYQAFAYQRDVVGDCSGAVTNPFRSKLSPLFEVVKMSASKNQKRFLSNFCAKIDFEPEDLVNSEEASETLLYSRFLIQNLAFFEYGRMEELIHAISCIEKTVTETGTGIAHAIDTELFKTTVGVNEVGETILDPSAEELPAQNPILAIDPQRLKHLTICSMILSMLWEARRHLRRLYGITSASIQRDKKAQAKDMSRAPTKVHTVNGDKFWETISNIMDSLASIDSMTGQCQRFSILMSIDDELKVAAENEEGRESLDSASVDLENGTPGPSGRGKRKSSMSASGTPQKRKRGRPSGGLGKKRKSSSAFDEDGEWD